MFCTSFVVRGRKGYEAPEPHGVVALVRVRDVGAAAPESGVCLLQCCLGSYGRQEFVACVVFWSGFPHKLDNSTRFLIRFPS